MTFVADQRIVVEPHISYTLYTQSSVRIDAIQLITRQIQILWKIMES